MRFNYFFVVLFFVVVAVGAYLLFPNKFDLVDLYSFDKRFSSAYSVLEGIEQDSPKDVKISVERAKIHFQSGQYWKAVELLQSVVQVDPKNLPAWRLMAQSYDALRLKRESMAAYEGVISVSPLDPEALANLGELYTFFQMTDDAIDAYSKLTAITPDEHDHWAALGRLYVQAGRLNSAIDTLYFVADRWPNDQSSLNLLIELLNYAGRTNEVIALNKKLIKQDPSNQFAQLRQAKAYSRERQFKKAYKLYGSVIRKTSNPSVFLALGQGYIEKKDWAALPLYEALMEKFGDNPDVQDGYVTALLLNHEYAKAFNAFNKGPALRYTEDRVYSELAYLYRLAGKVKDGINHYQNRPAATRQQRFVLVALYEVDMQFKKAAKLLNGLAASDPGNRVVQKMKINLYEAALDEQGFLAALQSYTTQWPDEPGMQLRLAQAYDWNQQYSAEVNVMKPLVEVSPENASYNYQLAQGYAGLKKYGLAAFYYDKALALEPGSQPVHSGFISVLQSMTPSKKARQYAENLYRAVPDNQEAALVLAYFYEREKNYDKADQIYERLTRNQSSSDLYASIGYQALDAGRGSRAKRYFRKGLFANRSHQASLHGMAKVAILNRQQGVAISYLDRLNRQVITDPDRLYELALDYEAVELPGRSRLAYRRFLKLVNSDPSLKSEYIRQRARAYARINRFQTAYELLDTGFKTQGDIAYKLDSSEYLIDLRRYRKAFVELALLKRSDAFRKAEIDSRYSVDAQENVSRFYVLKARAYSETGQWAQAKETLELAHVRYPQDQSTMLALADVYVNLGHRDKALPMYQRLIKVAPENEDYRRELAYFHYYGGDYDKALQLINPILRQRYDTDMTLLATEIYLNTGAYQNADALSERFLATDARDSQSLVRLGNAYVSVGLNDSARRFFTAVSENSLYYSQALKGTGLSYAVQDSEKARSYYLQALARDKQDYEIPMFIADTYGSDRRKARPYYQDALARLDRVRPQTISDQINKSTMLQKLGFSDRASDLLAKLSVQYPENTQVKIASARLALDQNRADDAIAILDEIGDPVGLSILDRRNLVFTRADAYRKKGYWHRAYKEYKAFVKQYPMDYYTKFQMADLLNQTGGWPTAVMLLHDILDADIPLALREQANELIASIHADRGQAVGYEFVFAGINGERAFTNRGNARVFVLPNLGIYLTGAHTYFDDQAGFTKSIGDLGAKARLWIFPSWDVAAHFVKTIDHLGDTVEFGAESRVRFGNGATLTVNAYKNKIWNTPLSTVANLGARDGIEVDFTLPFLRSWFLTSSFQWHWYHINRTLRYGEDNSQSIGIGRELYRSAYGHSFPLRLANLGVTYTRYHSAEDPALAPLIGLIDHSDTISLDLFLRFIFFGSYFVDVSTSVGADPGRQIGFGGVYGFTVNTYLELISNTFGLFGEGSYFSDSPAAITGGDSKSLRAGFRLHFDQFNPGK